MRPETLLGGMHVMIHWPNEQLRFTASAPVPDTTQPESARTTADQMMGLLVGNDSVTRKQQHSVESVHGLRI